MDKVPATENLNGGPPRITKGDSTLDVAYVTSRICVVGYPWKGRTESRIRRNNIDDLSAYLNDKHKDRYLLWNLSGVRDYDVLKFQDASRILNFNCGFVDIGTPTVDQLIRICYSFAFWLRMNPHHVVVVHGKDDPVAVGVAVSCFLLYAGAVANYSEALDLFLRKRLPRWRMDCSALPASYRRALIHFSSIGRIKSMKRAGVQALFFNCLIVYNLPRLHTRRGVVSSSVERTEDKVSRPVPRLEIFKGSKTIFSTLWDKSSVMHWDRDDGYLVIRVNKIIQGDLGLACYDGESKSAQTFFRFSTHSCFLSPGMVKLSRGQLDMTRSVREAAKKKGMRLELVLGNAAEVEPKMSQNEDEDAPLWLQGEDALKRGLREIANHHCIPIKSNLIRALEDVGVTGSPQEMAVALQLTSCDLEKAKAMLRSHNFTCSSNARDVAGSIVTTPASDEKRKHRLARLRQRMARRKATKRSSGSTSRAPLKDACDTNVPKTIDNDVDNESTATPSTMQTLLGDSAENVFQQYVRYMKDLLANSGTSAQSVKNREQITRRMVRDGLDPSVLTFLSMAAVGNSGVAVTTESSNKDVDIRSLLLGLLDSSRGKSTESTTRVVRKEVTSRDAPVTNDATSQQGSDGNVNPTHRSATAAVSVRTDAKASDEEKGTDPAEMRFVKMLKVGVPTHVVKAKMESEGMDRLVIQRVIGSVAIAPAGKPVSAILKPEHSSITSSKKAELGPFKRMIKMGVPKGAVAARMKAAGIDPSQLFGSEFNDSAKRTNGKSKKQASVKRLFWEPLDDDDLHMKDTIWSQMHDDDRDYDHKTNDGGDNGDDSDGSSSPKRVSLDLDHLRSLFMKMPSPAKSKQKLAKSRRKRREASQKIRLIDHKRAHNVEIILARLKLDPKSIRDCIRRVDIGENGLKLSVDHMISLRAAFPSDRDLKDVSSFGGDPNRLGIAERFFFVLNKTCIKTLRRRLDHIIFMKTFNDVLGDVKQRIATCRRACMEVKESQSLRVILKMVVELGNSLNRLGGRDGSTRGIRVKSLAQLGRTKSFDKKTTLLDFLETQVMKRSPKSCKIGQELSSICSASRISTDSLKVDSDRIRNGLNGIRRELKSLREECESSCAEERDRWTNSKEAVTDFLKRADDDLLEATEATVEARRQYAALATWFGEDESQKSTTFFATLHDFVRQFEEVHRKAEADRETIRIREAIRVRKAARSGSLSAPTSPTRHQQKQRRRSSLKLELETRRLLLQGASALSRSRDQDDEGEEEWGDD